MQGEKCPSVAGVVIAAAGGSRLRLGPASLQRHPVLCSVLVTCGGFAAGTQPCSHIKILHNEHDHGGVCGMAAPKSPSPQGTFALRAAGLEPLQAWLPGKKEHVPTPWGLLPAVTGRAVGCRGSPQVRGGPCAPIPVG